MKNHVRMGIAILTAITIAFSPNYLQAQEVVDKDYESGYVEGYYKISFEGLEFECDEETKELSVIISEDIRWYQKEGAKEAKERIEFLLGRYDDSLDKAIIEAIKGGDELLGVSYTECPVQMNEEGEMIRIPNVDSKEEGFLKRAGAAIAITKGEESLKYYFSLCTIVSRTYSIDSEGYYTYTCRTVGSWSENSALSGKKYPAGGEDYILQTTPNTFSRQSDSLVLTYNNGLTAESGVHYWKENGDTTYIRYAIVDDPLGVNQMSSCVLTTVCKAKPSTNRMINSYYVHTWKAMSLSVSVDVSSEKAVSLSITPGISDKSWQVYSYVTFDF